MTTLTEIKNQVHTIENISEEVFKYEMEISHLHENSKYYIVDYNKIYTSKGYNYILKNYDGNFYWSNNYINDYIQESKFPVYFNIKTHEYHKLINEHGNIYLDDSHNPIIELEVECEKYNMSEEHKNNTKEITKNKVVDDYYVSRYIYGLKYTLDTSQNLTAVTQNLTAVTQRLTAVTKRLTAVTQENEFNDVLKSHIDNLEKYFKKYHEEHEIREDIKFRFDNLEKYVKEKYENETKCFIKFYNNEECKDKLKIHLDNIEKYVIDYYEAEARRILRYY